MGGSVFKTLLKVAPLAAGAYFLGPGVVNSVGGLVKGAGSILGSSGLGGVLGGISAAGSLLGNKEQPQNTYIYNGQPSSAPVEPAQAEKFTPTQPAAMARPSTLSDLASFTPDQERASLATKGLNQGLGQDEDAYYRNLIQRSLVGTDGAVTGSVNSLLPIEQQYFGKRGIAMNDINSFLKGIST